MATEGKNTFPVLGVKTWWNLRKEFKNRLPSRVDLDYPQTVLGQQKNTASVTVSQLRLMKLIDKSGNPTDLANNWRVDDSYPQVCKTIFEGTYPTSLREIFTDPNPTKEKRSKLIDWFTRNAKVGISAARKMTAIYLLLLKRDPAEQDKVETTTPKVSKPRREPKPKSADKQVTPPVVPKQEPSKLLPFEPSLRVDVQIHIPKDATPEQIDQIFKSMAEHIYKIKK